MSILIKDQKMPKEGCKDCPLVKEGLIFAVCPFLKREVDGNVERGGKPYDCPLMEFPDHAVIWGTKADGTPVLMFIQPESKEEKDEHID